MKKKEYMTTDDALRSRLHKLFDKHDDACDHQNQ